MQELQQIVNDKIKSMVEDGSIQARIEKGVASAVDRAIEEQFQCYGGVTKALKKAMEEGLQIDTSNLPFETYNQQMLVAIKTKLGNFFAEEASTKFMSELDSLLEVAPKELPIKDLVEQIVATWKADDYSDGEDLDEYATVELEECDWSRDGTSLDLKMWKKKEVRFSGMNDSDVQLFISDGKIRINHKHKYNPTCFNEAEAIVFKLYAAGTTITGLKDFDPDDCDLTLKEDHY